MTKLTDGRRVMELTMNTYAADGTHYTPDWSGDFIGNDGGATYVEEIGAYLIGEGVDLEDVLDAARDANEATEAGGEPSTYAEFYDIGSHESTDAELVWAYKRLDTYDYDLGEKSICREILWRTDMQDDWSDAAEGEDAEKIMQEAADKLAYLVG